MSYTGMGSPTPARWRNVFLSEKGKKVMALLQPEPSTHTSELMVSAHFDSKELRSFADRFNNRRKRFVQSMANFELDKKTGDIYVRIVDDLTGKVDVKMSPEQVERGLKELEESTDNDSSLSSFFVDVEL